MSVTVLDIQFPVAISYGSSGGPSFLTRIISTQAGFEYRTSAWSRQRGKWNVAHGLKQPADYQALIAFFYSVALGRLNAFRFKDWTDFSDWQNGNTSQTVQNNAAGHMQLCKTYTFGGQVYNRFIDKPVAGTIVFSPPRSTTVNTTNGLTTGAQVGDTWTGQFDVPVRFDVDELDMSIDQPWGPNGAAVAASWRHIPIVEVKVPAP